MPQPTSVEVLVDDTEYSRYETSKNTITATVTVRGGAPYSSEDVILELTKARRSRDAVVASTSVTFSGNNDPQQASATFYLPDIVDQDLISLVRHGKYFIKAYSEAANATADIGSGANGTVTTTVVDPGSAGNSFTIEVVVPGGTSPLSVSRSGDAITVSLSVLGGVPVAADNTATRVAAAISASATDISASASGTGADSLSAAEGPTTFTGGRDEISDESGDFDIRIVTVERLKRDYLFGVPLTATSVKMPKMPPQAITGISFVEVNPEHPEGFATLTYSYTENDLTNATASIGSGANGTVTVEAGEDLAGSDGNGATITVEVPSGTSALSVSVADNDITVSLDVTAGVPNPAANTATLIAAAIDALSNFSATASGTGADSISTAEGPTLFTGGTTDVIRGLSWDGGTMVNLTGPGTYILRQGSTGPAAKLSVANPNQNYVCIRVHSTTMLPESSVTEELLIENQKLDDETLGRYLQQAIDWIEKDFLAGVFLEPTNVVTDRDPTTIQYAAGINASTPLFTDTDYDYIVSPLTYFVPQGTPSWVQIQTPYRQLLRVDSLYGAIANTRVIDIDLEWIEHSEQGGLIQLVPFNQEIAFDFVGLIWVNAIRGAVELPNFWHFNMIAGLRDCCADLQELIAKKAAIDALTTIAAAFRPGVGSLSLSRDGVSESVSYTTQYGIYTAAINAHKEWMRDNEKLFRAKYRGLDWVVV